MATKKVVKKHRINPQQARLMLCELEKTNEIFSVCFKKRTTGLDRCMNCRFKVKAALKGGKRTYDPADYNLFTVYDLKAKAYRSIALEGLSEIKRKSEIYTVVRIKAKKSKAKKVSKPKARKPKQLYVVLTNIAPTRKSDKVVSTIPVNV